MTLVLVACGTNDSRPPGRDAALLTDGRGSISPPTDGRAVDAAAPSTSSDDAAAIDVARPMDAPSTVDAAKAQDVSALDGYRPDAGPVDAQVSSDLRPDPNNAGPLTGTCSHVGSCRRTNPFRCVDSFLANTAFKGEQARCEATVGATWSTERCPSAGRIGWCYYPTSTGAPSLSCTSVFLLDSLYTEQKIANPASYCEQVLRKVFVPAM